MSGRLTHTTLRALDRVNRALLPKPKKAEHLQTGRRGEEEAYFYLRGLGYVMVARNWRSPRRKGELDLVGWDGDCLCFVEVKTRTTLDVKPAEAAVDADKQAELCAMAQEFLRLLKQREPQVKKGKRQKEEGKSQEQEGKRLAAGFLPFAFSLLPWRKKRSACEEKPAGSAPQLRSGFQGKVRFDVLSIYYLQDCGKPQFTLFKNSFAMS